MVRSGLEEIMSEATEQLINTALAKNLDLRLAAYYNSIMKLHKHYEVTGIA